MNITNNYTASYFNNNAVKSNKSAPIKNNANISFEGVRLDPKLLNILKENVHSFSGDEVVKITNLIKRLNKINIADGIIHYGQKAPHVNTPSKMFAELRDAKFKQIYNYTLELIEPEKVRDPRLSGPVEFAKTLFQSEKAYRNGSIGGTLEEGINFLKKHLEDSVIRVEKIYTQVATDEAAKAGIDAIV